MKDGDLARARMNEAEACFILAARNYNDKTAADGNFHFHFQVLIFSIKKYARKNVMIYIFYSILFNFFFQLYYRAYHIAFVGGEGFCSKCATIRSNISVSQKQ